MSTNNLLHRFRSYSYKHILIACNTTHIAEYISNMDGQSVFSQVISQRGAGGRAPFEDGATGDGLVIKSIEGSGDYCILINSFTDGEFYISNAEWQTILSPNYDKTNPNKDYATTVATEGTFTIVEPRGFRFLNIVNNIGVLLGCGAMSITWILKTVFVGHDDGSHTNEYIANIRPFLFNMTNVYATFDESGATYTMPVVASANGIAKAPQFSRVTLNSTTAATGSTLKDAMYTLQKNIQAKYDTDLVPVQGTPQYKETMRRIKYVIQLDELYQSDSYLMDNILVNNSGIGGNTGGSISFGNNVDIETMINTVMRCCKRISIDSKQTNANQIYKIYTVMTTTIDEAVITYVVRPLPVIESTDADGTELTNDGKYSVLEFDYIFTGKNIDIIDFQLKMENGHVFFQSLEMVPLATDDQSVVGKASDSQLGGAQKNSAKIAPMQILTPTMNTEKNLLKSVRNPLSTNDFNVALQKFAALETLAASITINGNPQLINDMNTLPSDFLQQTAAGTNNSSLSNWSSVPSLCKINVSMPSNSSLLGVNLSDPNSQFQVPFWYRGYFNILTIQHRFDNGAFTQMLGMINVRMTNQPLPAKDFATVNQTDLTQVKG
jgi:hypothetical protein